MYSGDYGRPGLTRARARGKPLVKAGAARVHTLGQLMDSATVNASYRRAFIERIEKLEEEKKAIAEDIKEVYSEAKGTGFDAKIIRKIVSMRKMDREKRREEEEILDLYLSALGMIE
jgi:uncharacterized protein (UPF0335 family)